MNAGPRKPIDEHCLLHAAVGHHLGRAFADEVGARSPNIVEDFAGIGLIIDVLKAEVIKLRDRDVEAIMATHEAAGDLLG